SKGIYVLHLLIGHHGIFSLSPIFLLTAAGTIYGLVKTHKPTGPANGSEPDKQQDERPQLRMVALLTLLLSVVVLAFYIALVNDRNRNYGGWTSGLRCLLCLTPLWL